MTTTGVQTIIYPVKDRDRARELFRALLGVEPYADEPYYVGFKAAGQDVGLDPHGHAKGMTGPVPYWHVTDLRDRLAALLEGGAELLQDAQDVGNGRLIASVKDTDGNLIGLLQDPVA
ncbi:glyoxalase [Streptomyces longwoodensis]|uniref:Glyoxalase n=1 Tax=Streptomyces lasalocidi TaxID=324833 RepID=A0A4U5WG46_STRLS|nr:MULTISPECIES: VOC family protein [Streptomyces]MCX4999849.1 glyoxalase [Streptomyces longwoodensis]TKS99375.1 glyoxalase [Streptomyces lasalocidi]WTI48578.1 glyoxalase [Streptomyces longwoodensis]WUC61308.1 glyoxalase [Streptomyces longwoodensis]WUC74852.1 glyoxalase [Streptomyces longwoodensis]